MSYLEKDRSVADGAPVECYLFRSEFFVFAYTNDALPVTITALNVDTNIVETHTYQPLPISRGEITTSAITGSEDKVEVKVPANSELAKKYCYQVTPPRLSLEIRQFHRGDNPVTEHKVIWVGTGIDASVSDKWATIGTGSVFLAELKGNVALVKYQRSCNHQLYDARCKVNKAAYTFSAQVLSSRANQILEVTRTAPVGAGLLNDLARGEMRNTRSGEVRAIVASSETPKVEKGKPNGVLRSVTLAIPFFDLKDGDTVDIAYGCDHLRLGHCLNRFQNTLNYGGHDFIPQDNPFTQPELVKNVGSTQVSDQKVGKLQNLILNGQWKSNEDKRLAQYNNAYGANNYGVVDTRASTVLSQRGSLSAPSVLPDIKLSLPAAEVGASVPYVLGQRRVTSPNVLYSGGVEGIYEQRSQIETRLVQQVYKKPETGLYYNRTAIVEVVTTADILVGYSTRIQFGVCLGPNVQLLSVYNDGVKIWSGTAGPARTEIKMKETETALSKATAYFHGGNFNQPQEPFLPGDHPAYVGTAYILFKDLQVDKPLGSLSFEVRRLVNPINVAAPYYDNDVAIPSAIYDIITNEWGGAGIHPTFLNNVQLASKQGVLAAYGNYCSMLIDSETSAQQIVASLAEQANAIVYQNPANGKVEWRLEDEALTAITAENFGPTNIIQIDGLSKDNWKVTVETLFIEFVNKYADYEDDFISLQNPNNVDRINRPRGSQTLNYPYCSNADLAYDICGRKLKPLAMPQFNTTLTVTRDGASLLPNSLIFVSYPEYGIYTVPMLVESVAVLPVEENLVKLSGRQISLIDLPIPYTRPAEPPPAVPLYVAPVKPVAATFITAPYWIAARKGLIGPDAVGEKAAVLILPTIGNGLQGSFTAQIANVPGALANVDAIPAAEYPTYAELTVALSKFSNWADGVIPSLDIKNVVNPVNLVASIGAAGVKAGRKLIFLNNEILAYEAAENLGGGSWRLKNVNRALIDTVATDHAIGSKVLIVDGGFSSLVPQVFNSPLPYTPAWRLISNTVYEAGKIEDALQSSAWTAAPRGRTVAPVRPHDTRIAGMRTQAARQITVGKPVQVSWRIRSRVALDIKAQTGGADEPEVIVDVGNQWHRVYVRDSEGRTHLIAETLPEAAVSSLNITVPVNVAAGPGSLFVRSVTDKGESLYDDAVPVTIWKGANVLFNYELTE